MSLLAALKRIPVDLGQGAVAETTEGKQIAMRLVPAGDGKRALDVGCRRGEQTRWLRARGYEVTPIDVTRSFADCLIADANRPLPFPSGHFDLVWCSEVIEHLQDPAASIAELVRVTTSGGRIILTTPNSSAWFFRLLARLGLPPARLQRPDHLHFFDRAAIARLCPGATVYGYFPYVAPKFTIRHAVGLLSPTFVIEMRKL